MTVAYPSLILWSLGSAEGILSDIFCVWELVAVYSFLFLMPMSDSHCTGIGHNCSYNVDLVHQSLWTCVPWSNTFVEWHVLFIELGILELPILTVASSSGCVSSWSLHTCYKLQLSGHCETARGIGKFHKIQMWCYVNFTPSAFLMLTHST